MKYLIPNFLRKSFGSQDKSDNFVINQLQNLDNGLKILDVGAGSMRYKKYCSHLIYESQDFQDSVFDYKDSKFGYEVDDNKDLNGYKHDEYEYGSIDIVCDLVSIPRLENEYDAILCTEVLEHIYNPAEAIKEFSRLLKPNGKLIITSPVGCIRHMDPHFYSHGLSDRWFEKSKDLYGFSNIEIRQDGDYYSFLSYEIARFAYFSNLFIKLISLPVFVILNLKKTSKKSIDTIGQHYFVVITK